MFRRKALSGSLTVAIMLGLGLQALVLRIPAQDLVATDDLTGGSSVFVFHGSSKQPQVRSGGGRVRVGNAFGRVNRNRSAGQISSQAKKRRAAATATRPKTTRVSKDRKAALSNTLTAKAEQFLDSDQTDLAISNYRAALVQNPTNTRAAEGLSNALVAKGIETAGDNSNEAAIPYFQEAAQLDPKNDVAFAKLGEIYDAKDRNDEAVLNYEKALEINPEYTMLFPPLALVYYDKGDLARSEIYADKAQAAGIDTVDMRFIRGVLYFKQNKNVEALEAFDKALELDQSSAMTHYYKAQTLDRLGRMDEAVAEYRKTLEIDPKNSGAAFDLGVALYNRGDYNGAVAADQQSIESDPDNAQTHANLASSYRQLEKYPEANGEYKIASKGITTKGLYSEWGYCLGKTDEWEKASARLITARDLEAPTAIDDSNIGWAYYNNGHEQTEAKNDTDAKKNYETAREYLKKAVGRDPKLDAAYVNLGSTYNELDDYQNAVNALNTALSLHPNWTIALNQLGVGYRGLKDLKNAIEAFNQVVALDSGSKMGLYNLSEAYWVSGDKKAARRINDQLRKLDPRLAGQLDIVIAGKAVIDAAKQKVRIPHFP